METQTQSRPPTAKPAGLGNILNNDDQPSPKAPPPQLRDSGFYSTADTASKHTSAASFSANGGLSPTNSGYHSAADKTPSPVTTNMAPQAVVSPTTSNMSVASMVSPTTPGSGDQRRIDRPTSLESAHYNGAPVGDGLHPASASRRESVDSRINQGISDMRLGASPYASSNHSTTSIQNTLHSQRNPRPGLEALSVHRISNGYAPSVERNPEPARTGKTAPAITGPATSNIARAAEPTKGQAWAFPEEEIQRVGPPLHYNESRRSSITESVASSQFTIESRLPPGQRRLDEGPDFARMSNISTELPPVHHHSMQHKQLSDLQAEEGSLLPGSQPYSRTPELRVSHKLAERKRRTEMKELFDELRDLMPQERGSKASKWEILTKAIAEHRRQSDHIRALQNHYNSVLAENEMLRRELNGRVESGHMRNDIGSSSGMAQPQPQPAAPPAQGHPSPYPQDQYAGAPRNEQLPPLRAISNNIPNGSDTMTGVQYDAPRVNGYHHPEQRY